MQTLQQLTSGQLKGSKTLKLSDALTVFPPEILELHETLEVLDLSGNKLTQLPDDFGKLKKLKIAFFSNNNFTEFPAVLAQCPLLEMVGFKACRIAHIPEGALPQNLRWLILTDNQVAALPAGIGKCIRLQKCMLAGNRLKSLPAEMALCQNLQLLRISANAIDELPHWLLSMPQLSWLAFAGNPCSRHSTPQSALPKISWNDLEPEELLGEGASGVITKALWSARQQEQAVHVAVKVFKGEVTSDGLPADEMAACVAAGVHPHLVQVLGELTDHPEARHGLVLGLIPPTFRNLGGPPNFQTCTRDVFPEGTAFAYKQILYIATGIASAAAQIHANGVMHGDLYAHNTLVDDAAHPLIGDFGAATIYGGGNPETAFALERLEVRAFACLLDDLLLHVAPADAQVAGISVLADLRQDCMQPEVLQRPSFSQIYKGLNQVAVSASV